MIKKPIVRDFGKKDAGQIAPALSFNHLVRRMEGGAAKQVTRSGWQGKAPPKRG